MTRTPVIVAIFAALPVSLAGCAPAPGAGPAPGTPLTALIDDAACVLERVARDCTTVRLEGAEGVWTLHCTYRPPGAGGAEVFHESGPDFVGMLHRADLWIARRKEARE